MTDCLRLSIPVGAIVARMKSTSFRSGFDSSESSNFAYILVNKKDFTQNKIAIQLRHSRCQEDSFKLAEFYSAPPIEGVSCVLTKRV